MGIRDDLASGRFIDEMFEEEKELSKFSKADIIKEINKREYLATKEKYEKLKKYEKVETNKSLKKYSDYILKKNRNNI